MIPQICSSEITSKIVKSLLSGLRNSDFEGDIHHDYATRLVSATDNSIYQVLPQAVIFPKNSSDIKKLLKISNEKRFRNIIKITPRGGGTGTNGQSLTEGIVLDCSRYMNKILETNLNEGWVLVESGVVLDQLNEHLAPLNMFFAPDLSPSNRATLGGMVNTDACGKGSRIYGRTSDHILALSCILSNGEELQSVPLDKAMLSQYKKKGGITGKVFEVVDRVVKEKANLIEEVFPKMSRFMTGYNLAKVYGNSEKKFNLNYLLSGSEGTLAIVSEVKLRLTPLPKYNQLLVVKYEIFDDALRDAKNLLEHEPAAIETIDEKILGLAKKDEIYPKIKDFIADEIVISDKKNRSTGSISLIEFCGNNKKKLEKQINSLCQKIDFNKSKSGEATGYYRTAVRQEIKDLWTLRKKGVGLLGNTKGSRKPLPFVEDTAVPPKNLANYIYELRKLLEKFNLDYAMFGHVDVGCLHVRPALDLKNLDDERLVRELSNKVVKLVKKFEGVMWSEHGRGFRSEYTVDFFGDELHEQLRIIKEAFDPENRLNPGKIVTPFSKNNDKVVTVEGPLRGHKDKQINNDLFKEYESAINCNGNGACLDYQPNNVMCPSSRITRDHLNSPKGRAILMREWIRILSLSETKKSFENKKNSYNYFRKSKNFIFSLKNFKYFVKKIINTVTKKSGDYDFSNEVYESMKGCLICKACVSHCPVHVNVPEFRSKFIYLYHTRYLRPLKDYIVGSIETTGHFFSKMPFFINYLISSSLINSFLKNQIGLRDLPKFSPEKFKKIHFSKEKQDFDLEKLISQPTEKMDRSLILLQDAFTSFYESQILSEFYALLCKLDFNVFVAPFHPNGKPLHVKGFLNQFRDVAEKNTKWLTRLASCGVPLVGLEPSVVLTYRDEYLQILGQEQLPFEVFLPQEFLINKREKLRNYKISTKINDYQLLGHCTEMSNSQESQDQWRDLFNLFGLSLRIIEVGCCGMAGTFGHETEHYEESLGIYNLSWKDKMPADSFLKQNILTTGFSCRSQVMRIEGFRPLHPLQALLREIKFTN